MVITPLIPHRRTTRISLNQNNLVTQVPQPPNKSTRYNVVFDEFIHAVNRPSYYVTGMSINGINNPGNNIIVPDKDPDYVLDPLTLVNEYNWSMLTSADWSDMGLS